MPACRMIHATGSRPGAIGIIQLLGECIPVLQQLTGVDDWPLHRSRLCNLAGIDHGIAVRLTDEVAQLMPHGGPRVMQRLTARLIELGVQVIANPADAAIDPCELYPEAADRIEALMLAALARAQSPLAIDLLLDQPRRWRESFKSDQAIDAADRVRSHRLNRLINPPIVVLAGKPNVGKSTLSNALLGRSMSIALDMPGTTRDYTTGRIDLAGLVVDWHDTPGLCETKDPIEAKAIGLARRLVERSDLLIAMRDPATEWPDLPRNPDLWVMNKADLLIESTPGLASEASKTRIGVDVTHQLQISATRNLGIQEFVAALRERLVPAIDLQHSGTWLFDQRLINP